MVNTTGATASYNNGMGTVTLTDSVNVLQVCYNTTYVYVRSEGLADYEMGPFNGNPNAPSAQGYTFKIPRNPVEETGTNEDNPWGGPLGVAVNGVPLYGFGDARSYNPSLNANVGGGLGVWNSDAWMSEGSTMDATGAGHPDPNGNYHHHATPIALYSDPSTSHSPIVGFAADGFPIYGPWGYSSPMDNTSSIQRITSGYTLRSITTRTILPDGSTASTPGPNVDGTFPLGTYAEDYEYTGTVGDLDEYNGRLCVTPDYPNGTYAYFVTTDSNGDPAFPYIMGPTYYGVVSNADIGPNAGNASIPAGVSCGTISEIQNMDISTDPGLYPNPFIDQFTITIADNLSDYTLDLYNLQGQLVKEIGWGSDQSRIQIDARDLKGGTYYLQIKSKGKLYRSPVRIFKL
jgi:hypothetical protein